MAGVNLEVGRGWNQNRKGNPLLSFSPTHHTRRVGREMVSEDGFRVEF